MDQCPKHTPDLEMSYFGLMNSIRYIGSYEWQLNALIVCTDHDEVRILSFGEIAFLFVCLFHFLL